MILSTLLLVKAPKGNTPGWASTRKVKPTWILIKQETVSGNGISWAICKSAPHSRQITTPAPHCSVLLQAGCPSCRPTNSVKALKGKQKNKHNEEYQPTDPPANPTVQGILHSPLPTLPSQYTYVAELLTNREQKVCRYKWHSASSLGWPFPRLKY